MGKDQNGVEIYDEETIAKLFNGMRGKALVSDVRERLLRARKQQIESTVWTELTEMDQKNEIAEAGYMASFLVSKIAEFVAAAGNPCVTAQLDNFKIKDNIITITAKGVSDDDVLIRLNCAAEKVLKIIVVDVDQFSEVDEPIEPDKDQPDLLDSSDSEPSEDEEIVVDEDIDQAAAFLEKTWAAEDQEKVSTGGVDNIVDKSDPEQETQDLVVHGEQVG